MQYLLYETLAVILLDLGLIQIISQGQLGILAEVYMAGAHTVMGQVLYLPAHAPKRQFHACSHMWVSPLGARVSFWCCQIPTAHKVRVKSCKMSSSISFASDTVVCGSQRLSLFGGSVAARDVLCHC